MKTKNIEILFVSLPPSIITIPSPPFSVLKAYLARHSVHSEILYINHLIEKEHDFLNYTSSSTTESIIPFLGLINKKNPKKSKYIQSYYNCLFPDLFLTERSYKNDILKDFENQCLKLIDITIQKIKHNNCKIVGFTSKFSQWLPAIFFAEYIKQAFPDIKIITGGWTNSQAAIDFLKLNPIIDYGIWGEGEIPLLKLTNYILSPKTNNITEIPRLVYNHEGKTYKNNGGTIDTYIDFDKVKLISDFEDYFASIKKLKLENVLIPLERGRGCNWNKCKFCYLAQGYKFRIKRNDVILKEIIYHIEKLQHYKFFFTDNDIIGYDISDFNQFLDSLIELKSKYNELEIIMAEIISKGVDVETIKKMRQAGFKNVQVGVEAISSSLLSDINKKQNIIENFFFIKKAIKNGLTIRGANIITESPNETDEMIMESIDNLHCYRFLLKEEDFNFEIIPLCVSNYSKYLREIKDKEHQELWNLGELDQIVPNEYLTKIDRFSLMHFSVNQAEKPLWVLFKKALAFYKRKEFSYKVDIDHENQYLHYTEYSKTELIKDIEVDDKVHWHILNQLNDNVYKIDKLYENVKNQFKDLMWDQFSPRLEELFNEDLIFIDKKNDFVVSVIDLN